MTKSNSKKSLVASGLSLAVSAALLLGTTFAWFTDSVTSAGNKIQAGNLQVDLLMDKAGDGNYVSIADSDKGDIFSAAQGGNGYNWEPGMTQIVYLAVKNTGSLALNYNFILDVTDGNPGLADALDYAVLNGTTADDLKDAKTWEDIVAISTADVPTSGYVGDVVDGQTTFTPGRILEAKEMATFAMAVHMDEEAGNEYQNGSITIDVNLVAKQAMSETDGFGNPNYDADADWPPVSISNADQLKQALADAQPGDVLSLQAGTYALEESLVIPSGVSLMGAQAGTPASQWADADANQKTIIKAPNTGDRVLQILQNDAASPVSNVVLDGIEIDGEGKYVKGIYVKKEAGAAMQGIVIRNCAVVNTDNDGIDVSNTDGAVIENNYVSHVADNGIRLGNYKNTDGNTAYVRNNVIDTVSATQNGAIMVESGAGDVVVSGNVISNVTAYVGSTGSSEMKRSAIHVYDVFEGGVVTIENNSIANADQGIAVYKFSSLTDADKVAVRGNTVTDYKTFAIATSTLNNEKLDVTTLVEITGNDFSTAEPAADGLYIERTNQFGETTHNWRVEASGNTAGNDTYIAD